MGQEIVQPEDQPLTCAGRSISRFQEAMLVPRVIFLNTADGLLHLFLWSSALAPSSLTPISIQPRPFLVNAIHPLPDRISFSLLLSFFQEDTGALFLAVEFHEIRIGMLSTNCLFGNVEREHLEITTPFSC